MGRARSTGWIAALLVTAALLLVPGCSSSSAEAPQSAELNAALATASTSVADASTYIIGLKQAIPGAPSNDDLEKLQTTVNAASRRRVPHSGRRRRARWTSSTPASTR